MNSAFQVLTVSQLNYYVRSMLESDELLAHVFLRGEISNFKNHYASGHLYLSLKDEKALIRAVMFRGSAQKLRFLPADGMKVIAMGRVSLYDRDGQYQFYIDDLQPDGAGALSVAFEQLKERLRREGLFDEARKKPLPRYPERIGVITSATGAAYHDIVSVLARRWPVAKVVFCPVEVQGAAAPPAIVAALGRFNTLDAADVIICGRGGGSLEELWAFDEESVARAVAASHIPVVSAVGHETDFTIADFAADVRAPTPSAAAELVSPDRTALLAQLGTRRAAMLQAVQAQVSSGRQRLAHVLGMSALRSPLFALAPFRMRLDRLTARMTAASSSRTAEERERLAALSAKLDALSPLKVLARGYAVVSRDGVPVPDAAALCPLDGIHLRFRDGAAECTVNVVLPAENGQ